MSSTCKLEDEDGEDEDEEADAKAFRLVTFCDALRAVRDALDGREGPALFSREVAETSVSMSSKKVRGSGESSGVKGGMVLWRDEVGVDERVGTVEVEEPAEDGGGADAWLEARKEEGAGASA